jgi:hypothetical protein
MSYWNIAKLSSNRIVDFWNNVQFGGVSDWALHRLYRYIFSPSAIYNFNEYVALGWAHNIPVQQQKFYSSNLYGGSILYLIL